MLQWRTAPGDRPEALYGRARIAYSFEISWEKETSMKAFLVAVIVALGMGVGAFMVMERNQVTAESKFSSGSVRN
jgi:hypothetical protein